MLIIFVIFGIIRKEQIKAREIYAGGNSVRKKYVCQN